MNKTLQGFICFVKLAKYHTGPFIHNSFTWCCMLYLQLFMQLKYFAQQGMLNLIPATWCSSHMTSSYQNKKPQTGPHWTYELLMIVLINVANDDEMINIAVSLPVGVDVRMQLVIAFKNTTADLTCAVVLCRSCQICPPPKSCSSVRSLIQPYKSFQFYWHVLWNRSLTSYMNDRYTFFFFCLELLILYWLVVFLLFGVAFSLFFFELCVHVCVCLCSKAHVRTWTQQPIAQLCSLMCALRPWVLGCAERDVTCCCPLLSGSRWLEGWRRTSGPPRSHCE